MKDSPQVTIDRIDRRGHQRGSGRRGPPHPFGQFRRPPPDRPARRLVALTLAQRREALVTDAADQPTCIPDEALTAQELAAFQEMALQHLTERPESGDPRQPRRDLRQIEGRVGREPRNGREDGPVQAAQERTTLVRAQWTVIEWSILAMSPTAFSAREVPWVA